MRIAVCDDDLRDQEQLDKAIQGWDPTRGTEKFINGAALLEAAKRPPVFDIAFLDIYMPGENGVDIARALKKTSPETEIVFITTSESHAVPAFSLGALHYLVKPVTTDGIIEAFRRLAKLRARQRETLSFSVGGGVCTVFLSQICALESGSHAVEVSLDDGRRMKTRTPLCELAQKLGKHFLKVNRGVIVNMEHIERMGTDCCILRNGSRFFLAVRERSAICAAYSDYLLDRFSRRENGQEAGS